MFLFLKEIVSISQPSKDNDLSLSNSVKDPRLRTDSQSKDESNLSSNLKLAPYKNPSGKSAVNVMNKIMTSLHPKNPKSTPKLSQTRLQDKEKQRVSQPIVKVSNSVPNVIPIVAPKNNFSQKLNICTSESKSVKSDFKPSIIEINAPKPRHVEDTQVVSINSDQVSSSSSSITPHTPIPLPNAFAQLSDRDMQIAAQAAAIATAMHQMQSSQNGIIDTGQSASLAAKLIQLVQSTSSPINPPASLSAPPKDSLNHLENKDTINKYPSDIVQLSLNEIDNESNNSERFHERNYRKQSGVNEIPNINRRDASPTRNQARSNISLQRSEHSSLQYDNNREQSNISDLRNQDWGREQYFDEPPNKKLCDEVDRSRKARARSPSRYHFRMEKKIEGDKKLEENKKEPVRQNVRKNNNNEPHMFDHRDERQRKQFIDEHSDLDDIDLPEVGERNFAPAGAKPERLTQEEWIELKKVRRKEFRNIKGKIYDTERENPETFPMEVYEDLNREVMF